MKALRFGIGIFIVFVLLPLVGCETIQPAPQLKIPAGTITYIKVVPDPRPIGIGMTRVDMGLIGKAINDHTESQSKRLADLTGNDHALALQSRF